ncbi:MAG: hypothetical protein ACI9ON_003989 [Limisphaerales bacterium]|jgi:hypothetical protein
MADIYVVTLLMIDVMAPAEWFDSVAFWLRQPITPQRGPFAIGD